MGLTTIVRAYQRRGRGGEARGRVLLEDETTSEMGDDGENAQGEEGVLCLIVAET